MWLFDAQQLRSGLAQNLVAVTRAHIGEAFDCLNRVFQAHVEAVVAAQQHAVGADLADQVAVDRIVVAMVS